MLCRLILFYAVGLLVMADISIRCHIKGYGKNTDKPLSLLAVMNIESSIIKVIKQAKFDKDDNSHKYSIITNDRYMDTREFLFEESHIQEAIRAYFEFKDSLDLADGVMKYNPDNNAIQVAGINESGKDYVLSFDTINNGTMAILAICLFAKKQKSIENSLSYVGFDGEKLMSDDEDDLSDVITIE